MGRLETLARRWGWLGGVLLALGCGTEESGAGGAGGIGPEGGSGAVAGGSAHGGAGGAGAGGVSWDVADPPVHDPATAQPYCQAALDMFHQQLSYYRDTAAPRADLNELYHMERLFHGMTAVYEVTGDAQVVSDLLDISLAVVAAGQDVDGDGYLDYCFRNPDGSTPPTGWDPAEPCCDWDSTPSAGMMPTYPWRAMRGLARTLRAVKSSPLATERAADLAVLRDFIRHDVIDKWLDLDGNGPDAGKRGTDTAGILARMAGILLDYYAATGEQPLGDMASEWALRISTDMEPSTTTPGAYVFDNWVRAGDPFQQAADTSHANEIAVALIEGFEAGFFDYSLVGPLQSTLLDVMWNGDLASPMFSGYVDGTSDAQWPAAPDTVVLGWMRLGQFKGTTQTLSAAIQFSQSYDLEVIEASGHLCRNFGLALAEYPTPVPL
jgi:hypothetical protein